MQQAHRVICVIERHVLYSHVEAKPFKDGELANRCRSSTLLLTSYVADEQDNLTLLFVTSSVDCKEFKDTFCSHVNGLDISMLCIAKLTELSC